MRWIIVTVAVAGVFSLNYQFLAYFDNSGWQMGAFVVLDSVAYFVLLVIAMNYAHLVHHFSKVTVKLSHAVFGLLALPWLTLYKTEVVFVNPSLASLVFAHGVFFLLFGRQIGTAIVEAFPISERERRRLVNHYPPRRYGDMATFSVVMVVVALMPLLAKHLVWR